MKSAYSQFWLEAFSQENAWQRGLDDTTGASIVERVSDEEISEFLRELSEHRLEADREALTNLLRHWTRVNLDDESFPTDAKSIRNTAKKLSSVLAALEEVFDNGVGGLAYPLSQHLDHPFRVHRSRDLLRSLRRAASDLQPAAESLASASLTRGRKTIEWKKIPVAGLIEIFEGVTRRRATRTFHPIKEIEVGAFRVFCVRALRLIDFPPNEPIDTAIREAISDHRKRNQRPPIEDFSDLT